MTPTTTSALSAAFVAAIQEIAPRHAHESGARWAHTPSGRTGGGGAEGLAGTTLRSFELCWDPGVPGGMLKGAAGEDYVARLRVATSYAAVPPDELAHMITADAIDLRRTLIALAEPTVDGLIQVQHTGVGAYQVDDQADAVVEHVFLINWLQNTDAQ